MSRPLFEVGEVVLLRSQYLPECNGEATVLSVLRGREVNASGDFIREAFVYRLTIQNPNPKRGWAESALRKKHQPGEQSFRDLIQTLKQGQPA
ncbi:hypothetical protein D9M71_565020 [compost metagenome]